MVAHKKYLQGIYLYVCVWLQLRKCIYHLAIYGCQKLGLQPVFIDQNIPPTLVNMSFDYTTNKNRSMQ